MRPHDLSQIIGQDFTFWVKTAPSYARMITKGICHRSFFGDLRGVGKTTIAVVGAGC